MEHELQLSSLEEPVIEAILAGLENKELRILSRKYLRPDFPIDSELISRRLSRDMNFTLQTKLTLTYDVF